MKKLIKTLVTTVALAASVYLPAAQASIITVGSASVLNDGSIRLTNSTYQGNAAWYDTALSTTSSFIATFDFSLANPGSGLMADGFSFALQNKGTNVVGANGGNIGYSGLNAVGAVFQTYANNHIGIDSTGNANNTKSFTGASLGAAKLITGSEIVSYDAISKLLTMSSTFLVDGVVFAFEQSLTIDLAKKFGTTMYAGFTGGSGANYAVQTISNYSLNAVNVVPEPASIALLMVGLAGIGFAARRKSI